MRKLDELQKIGKLADEERSELFKTLQAQFAQQQFRVLIAHKDTSISSKLVRTIRTALPDVQIAVVESQEEGINSFKANPANLILSGYRLLEGDCYRIYDKLKADYKFELLVIDSYTDTEARNLKKTGLQLIPLPLKYFNIHDIVLGYYAEFLKGK